MVGKTASLRSPVAVFVRVPSPLERASFLVGFGLFLLAQNGGRENRYQHDIPVV